jgi:hypothetical protein
MMQRIGAKVMGESALIDKETGRIFWEGGSKTSISASISPLLSDLGIHRLKSTLLSIVLLTCLLAILAKHLRVRLGDSEPLAWPTAICMVITRWTLLKLPEFDNWFLLTVVTLYLWEAYHCNTRRYLANAISIPDEVEEYIERLRQELPQITWKVRCFHYEQRAWASILLPRVLLRKIFRQEDSDSQIDSTAATLAPSFLTKKVVIHEAEANYEYNTCLDNTIAGVWKRATAPSFPPPFTKIKLTKLLILGNNKARQEYFRQQANFVTTEGRLDEYAEFSTNISLKGFKPKLLAVRPIEGVLSARLFRLHMFWIFTLLGLTLPFRVWFSRHCDELRVTVAKETLAEQQAPPSKSWFGRSASSTNNDPAFRQAMQELSLYDNPERQYKDETVAALLQDIQEASEVAQLVNSNQTATATDDNATKSADDMLK